MTIREDLLWAISSIINTASYDYIIDCLKVVKSKNIKEISAKLYEIEEIISGKQCEKES